MMVVILDVKRSNCSFDIELGEKSVRAVSRSRETTAEQVRGRNQINRISTLRSELSCNTS